MARPEMVGSGAFSTVIGTALLVVVASDVLGDVLDSSEAAVPFGADGVETGFEHTSNPAQVMADHRGGWDEELDKLVALLERDA